MFLTVCNVLGSCVISKLPLLSEQHNASTIAKRLKKNQKFVQKASFKLYCSCFTVFTNLSCFGLKNIDLKFSLGKTGFKYEHILLMFTC